MEPDRVFSDPTAAPIPSQRVSRHLGRPDPVEALARLRAGNVRFTLGTSQPVGALNGGVDLRPYAVVVGCIDPRVPVETVFGQGVGAICVVRSAGHVLDLAVMGSVEFAVTDSLDMATRSHIHRTVATLRQADYLKDALTARRIDVVGGIYRLESGHVEML